ncbi:MAG: energy transducer TonB [Pseudomonadota bacterium]
MSTLSFSTNPYAASPALADTLRARIKPLAFILALHLLFFYAAWSGLLHRAVEAALPQAVVVTFVAPPEQHTPPPPPALPTLAAPAPYTPPLPAVSVAPVEASITVQTTVAAVVEKTPAAAPVNAAPALAATGPKTISTGVEYLQAPQPVYPAMSRRMGEQGKVVLRVLVNEKGLAEQATVQSSSGSTRLDEAGRQAALRALFKPHLEDGRAVPVYVIIPLNFQLS